MNEIEEYLLMIFLEENNRLNENIFGWHKLGTHVYQEEWNHFRFQELGRTLPEEFELYISKEALDWLREGESIGISIANRKYENTPIKIKITVVEDD